VTIAKLGGIMTTLALTGQRPQGKRDADARYYASEKGQANRLRKKLRAFAAEQGYTITTMEVRKGA
jgi:hypothetical protein